MRGDAIWLEQLWQKGPSARYSILFDYKQYEWHTNDCRPLTRAGVLHLPVVWAMLRYDGGYRVYEAEADVFTDEDLLSFLDRVVAIARISR